MRSTRQSDTTAEITLRRALHSLGMRYRLNVPVPGARRRRIDIAFMSARIAVLVDGCFWHGCPIHGTWPRANAAFWRQKIERNQLRDQETTRILEERGWCVYRVWEHEEPELVAQKIFHLLRERTGSNSSRG